MFKRRHGSEGVKEPGQEQAMAEAHIIVLHQRTSCARPMAHEMITRSLTFITVRFHAGASSDRCTKKNNRKLEKYHRLTNTHTCAKEVGVEDKVSTPKKKKKKTNKNN